ncbi:hypothetical protein PANDA_013766, partial [Ailuropoda melanoleuca]
ACMPLSCRPPMKRLSRWPNPDRKSHPPLSNPVLSLGPEA